MTITDGNDLITGIRDHDSDIIATTLLNVCIMAADRRGGRRMLNVDDFAAFKTMLEAADGIGPVEHVEQTQQPAQQQQPAQMQQPAQEQQPAQTYRERPDAIQSGLEAVAEAIAGTTLPPNAL